MTLILTTLIFSAELSSPVQVAPELSRGEKLAPWTSLIVPGAGELMRGYKLKGELLLWGDGIAVATVAGFSWDALNKRNSSLGMARMNAGANPNNSSRAYLSAMEEYLSSYDYNQDVAIEARNIYPDDYAAQQEYILAHSYTAEDEWVWSSDSLQLVYLEQRKSMRSAWKVSQAFMGVMLLTRVISVFDVAFLSPPQGTKVGFVPIPDPNAPGFMLTYRF